MPPLLIAPIAAGIASALIFTLLSIAGFNGLFMIFSGAPILYLGYTKPFAPLLIATAITSFTLLLFNPVSCLFFLAFIGVPIFFLAAHRRQHKPLGSAITDICAYAMVTIAGVQLSLLEQGGIAGWLASKFDFSEITHLDPKLMDQLHWLSQDGSYLLIGMVVWWAILFLLAVSWLVDIIIKNNPNEQEKPPISYFSRTPPPSWLLMVMIFSIIIGFLAPENIRFLGLLNFVIILLPYFFSGAMYTPLRGTLGRSLGWSLVVSVVVMVLAWPALLIAALGVLKHTHALINKE